MLIKNSIIFALTTLLKGVFTFSLIGVYTRLLSPAEYGDYIILLSIVIFVDAFAFQSVRHCLIRHVTSDQRPGDQAYISNAAMLYGALAALSVLLVAFVQFTGLLQGSQYGVALNILGLLIVGEALSNILVDISRIRNYYVSFVVINIAKPFLSLLCGGTLIWMGWGAEGALLGLLAALTLCVLWGVLKLPETKALRPGLYDPAIIKAMFMFGGPLALTFFIQSGIAYSGRFMLEGMMGGDIVGLYAAAQEIPHKLLSLAVIGVHIAAYPLAVKALEDGGVEACRRQLKSNFTLLFGIAFPGLVGMIMLAAPLADIFVGESFRPFMKEYLAVFAVLAFANVMIQYYLLLAFNLSKQNQKLIIPFFIALCLTLGVCYTAIPRYGVEGAVAASALSYTLLFVMTFLIGRKSFPLPFPLHDTLKIAAATVLMAGVIALISMVLATGGGLLFFGLSVMGGGMVYLAGIYALNVAELQKHTAPYVARIFNRS